MKINDLLRIAEMHSDVYLHSDGKPTYVFDEIGLQCFFDHIENKIKTEQEKDK